MFLTIQAHFNILRRSAEELSQGDCKVMVQRLSLFVFALRSDVHTGVRGQVLLIKIKKGYTSKIEVRSVTIFSGVLVQVVSVTF